MYNLFLFYYTYWLLVLIIYFFMDKSKVRSFYLVWTLVLIAASSHHIFILSLQISMTYLLLLLGTLILLGFASLQLYEYMVAFVCMIGYAALRIWEIVAPVWFFIQTNIILSLFIVFIVCLCVRAQNSRMIISLIGLTFGQLLYEIIIMVYHLNDTIGTIHEMTVLSITLILLVMIHFIQRVLQFMIGRIKLIM